MMSLSLLVIIIAALGVSRLGLASDYKIFFDEDDKDLQILENLQSIYSKTENVFIMIEPPGDTVFTMKTVELVHELSESLWQIPYASRVDSITNYPYSYSKDEEIIIEEFVPRGDTVTRDHLSLISAVALSEKDLVGKLLTESSSHTGINITLHLPAEDSKAETQAVNQTVKEILGEFESRYPEHSFYVSGIAIMNGAFIAAAKKDFKTLIPIMMVFVLIFAGFLLGSLRAAGIILLIVLLSFVGALGISGWLGINLSAPSISAPIIMFTVIVASTIHILSYVRRCQSDGATPQEAVKEAYSHNAAPIALSHITTIIGFLSMNLSDSPPFRDLGNIVVFGVVISLLQIFTILPFCISRLSFSRRRAVRGLPQITTRIAKFVVDRRLWILLLGTPLALALSSLATRSDLDDNLIRYFDKSVKFRQHAEAVDEHFSGLYNIDYSIDSGLENGVFDPQYLKFVNEFEEWLSTQDGVVYIDSVLHRIKDLNQLINNDNKSYYRIPPSKEIAAQNFLLYEMSLPFGRETTHFVSVDKSQMKVTVRLKNMSSEEVIEREGLINEWMSINAPSDYSVSYSSPALIFSHIGSRSIVSLLQGAALALVIISLSLMLIFRSFSLGLVSLIPNLLPITAAFGVWYIMHGQISMGLAGVAAMAIGIVVDDTVHFLFQYIRGVRAGETEAQSIMRTFNKTMPAICLSSVLLISGFMILATSSFEKNSDIGIMASITIFLALLFDMLYLPAIVVYLIKSKGQTIPERGSGEQKLV